MRNSKWPEEGSLQCDPEAGQGIRWSRDRPQRECRAAQRTGMPRPRLRYSWDARFPPGCRSGYAWQSAESAGQSRAAFGLLLL